MQCEKYLTYGFTNMHFDSHHHIHTDYAVWRAIEDVILEYGFNSIRLARNMNLNTASIYNKVYKHCYNKHLHHISKFETDYFGSIDDYIKDEDCLSEKISMVELMCHPDYEDETMRLIDTGGKGENKFFDTLFSNVNFGKLVSY